MYIHIQCTRTRKQQIKKKITQQNMYTCAYVHNCNPDAQKYMDIQVHTYIIHMCVYVYLRYCGIVCFSVPQVPVCVGNTKQTFINHRARTNSIHVHFAAEVQVCVFLATATYSSATVLLSSLLLVTVHCYC